MPLCVYQVKDVNPCSSTFGEVRSQILPCDGQNCEEGQLAQASTVGQVVTQITAKGYKSPDNTGLKLIINIPSNLTLAQAQKALVNWQPFGTYTVSLIGEFSINSNKLDFTWLYLPNEVQAWPTTGMLQGKITNSVLSFQITYP